MQAASPDSRLGITTARAYLVGGAPRTGKSTIAQLFLNRRSMYATSTDAIRSVLRGIVSSSEYPALFEGEDEFTEHKMLQLCKEGKATEIVASQQRESEVVWPAVKRWIESNVAEGYDVFIEGVAVMPKFVSSLNCDYHAIFVGNRSLHREAMLRVARTNPLDWLHTYDDESIGEFAKFTKLFSESVQTECRSTGYVYRDILENTYQQDIEDVVDTLLAA